VSTDRAGRTFAAGRYDVLTRGRPSVALDLKHPDAVATVLRLVETADVLVEGCAPASPSVSAWAPTTAWVATRVLVYGRMTGWGQTGPLSATAGHDLGYVAITGVLAGLGQDPDRPHFPTNLLGDFGGGSTYLVIGVLAALLEARLSGWGQVVDAAIVDGVAHLNAMGVELPGVRAGDRAARGQPARRRRPVLRPVRDGRRWSPAVGALEPQFYDALVEGLGIRDRDPTATTRPTTPPQGPDRDDGARSHARGVDRGLRRHRRLRRAGAAAQRGRAAPAPVARSVYVDRGNGPEPAPAPRFSRTAATLSSPPPAGRGPGHAVPR
jgi:alpha-methylacyl-CoA racemase